MAAMFWVYVVGRMHLPWPVQLYPIQQQQWPLCFGFTLLEECTFLDPFNCIRSNNNNGRYVFGLTLLEECTFLGPFNCIRSNNNLRRYVLGLRCWKKAPSLTRSTVSDPTTITMAAMFWVYVVGRMHLP